MKAIVKDIKIGTTVSCIPFTETMRNYVGKEIDVKKERDGDWYCGGPGDCWYHSSWLDFILTEEDQNRHDLLEIGIILDNMNVPREAPEWIRPKRNLSIVERMLYVKNLYSTNS